MSKDTNVNELLVDLANAPRATNIEEDLQDFVRKNAPVIDLLMLGVIEKDLSDEYLTLIDEALQADPRRMVHFLLLAQLSAMVESAIEFISIGELLDDVLAQRSNDLTRTAKLTAIRERIDTFLHQGTAIFGPYLALAELTHEGEKEQDKPVNLIVPPPKRLM